jgi:hypothetical protein
VRAALDETLKHPLLVQKELSSGIWIKVREEIITLFLFEKKNTKNCGIRD